jgi:hypothetical protein
MSLSDAKREFWMARLVYRVVSVCGALGCGFPHASLQKALDGRVDAVICNTGSIAASSDLRGDEALYCSRDAVKSDVRRMVEASARIAAPVILGNCETAGTDRDLNWMLEIAKEIFEDLRMRDVQVAVIRSEVAPAIVIDELRAGALRPVDAAAPTLDDAALRESTIVAQMGIHPIVAALQHGAKYMFVGRVCDAALFAADMIRHGVPAGLAYQTGHVLKGGASASEPDTDCLVAEIYDDGSAVFRAPNKGSRCTPYSLAVCSLDDIGHPHLRFFPEGVLTTAHAEFFAVDTFTAGIRGSEFYRTRKPWPLSVQLEGRRERGANQEWTVRHFLKNERIIRGSLFPITYYRANGGDWSNTGHTQADYFEVGDLAVTQDLDAKTLCAIEDVPPRGRPYGSHCVLDVARVVQHERADTAWLTVDLMFVSEDAYEMALLSNLFCARNLMVTLDLKPKSFVGSYFVDSCRAIRITLERPRVTDATGDHNGFCERHQSVIEHLIVPIYANPHNLAIE